MSSGQSLLPPPQQQRQQQALAFAAGAVTVGIVALVTRAVLARSTAAQTQTQTQPQSQPKQPTPATRGTLAEQLAALSALTPTPELPFSLSAVFHCRHPLPAGISIRLATRGASDRRGLAALMRCVATQRGGLAREVDEVTDAYIDGMMEAIDGGVMLLAIADAGSALAVIAATTLAGFATGSSFRSSAAPATIIGVLKASRIGPHRCFRSVLSDCTLAILPAFQNRKLGQQLFSALFALLATEEFRHVQRVELIARQSNRHALNMYWKVGFNVQAKLERRILSGTPLNLTSSSPDDAAASSSSSAAPASASGSSSATAAAAAVASDFSLQFESDIVMVWFNPAFDPERLKDQFRRSSGGSNSSNNSSRTGLTSPDGAPAVSVAAAAVSTAPTAVCATPVVAPADVPAFVAAPAAAAATPAVAPNSPVAAPVVVTIAAPVAPASPAAAAASSSPASPVSPVAAASPVPVAAPVAAAAVAASVPAAVPAVAAAAPAAASSVADSDSATSSLLASGLRLQSELSQWVRLVAAGDERAPMASATVQGDYDAMLVLSSSGHSSGGGAGTGSEQGLEIAGSHPAAGEARVKFFRLRILCCEGFYSCVTHWGLRGGAGGAAGGGGGGGVGQTSVTSTGAGRQGLDAAEDAFARKFYQKTGQHWEERRQFTPQEGKYCLVPLGQAHAQQQQQPAAAKQAQQSKANAKQKR